ncbi:hypothetical protein Dimus_027965 [Dionaea muscipula]
MSWLARSLANTLGIDDVAGDVVDDTHINPSTTGDAESSSFSKQQDERHQHRQRTAEDDQPGSPVRRVKDDLSEFTETLTRQLWGVANFLAPPPPSKSASDGHRLPVRRPNPDRQEQSDPSVSDDDESAVDADVVSIRGRSLVTEGRCPDEFGRFSDDDRGGATGNPRSVDSQGLHHHSSHNRIVWIYKDDERLVREAVGITDEVLAFAGNIAHHPETWLDYPIEEEEDLDDFVMSEAQKMHALAVQRLTPMLAALRIELCPAHMSDGYFWKVYFVLLHSRLNKHDAELLLTPQVVEARAKWMQELQKQTKKDLEWHHCAPKSSYEDSADFLDENFTSMPSHIGYHSESIGHRTYTSERASSSTTIDSEYERHRVLSSETDFLEKSVTEENSASGRADMNIIPACSMAKLLLQSFDDNDDDDDDWPEDDFSGHRKSATAIPIGIDDDVSFSDLEDDDFSASTRSKVGSKD